MRGTAFIKSVLIRYWQSLSWLKLSGFFLALFVFLFPFEIRSLIYSGSFYWTGNFNIYTSFFLYINDIFLALAVAFFCLEHLRDKQALIKFGDTGLTWLLLIFLGFFLIESFWIESKIVHFFVLLRFFEFGVFYFLLQQKILSRKIIVNLFLLSVGIQAFIAIWQYIFQSSLGLRILGESVADPTKPGVAKIDFAEMKILRAFGTFPHANILGGASMIALLFVWMMPKKLNFIRNIYLLLFSFALLFSFSRSAMFGLFAAFMIYIAVINKKIPYKKILLILSLVLFFIVIFNLESIIWHRFVIGDFNADQERTLYLNIGKSMLLSHPLGLGLGSYTLFMQNFAVQKIVPWVMQPVHNVFLLLTNEGGVIALGIFLTLLGYIFYRLVTVLQFCENYQKDQVYVYLSILVAIATVSLFDHYFFTLFPGQFMLFLYLGLTSEFLSNLRLPSRKS